MTQRAIFRCKSRDCRHVWAIDYPEKGLGKNDWFRRVPGEATVRFPSADAYDGCPKCKANHIWVKWGIVKGKRSEQPCDARCTNAKGFDCQCSCAGLNHGRGFVCEAA